MRKQLLVFAILFSALSSYSQVNYEPGYIINGTGEKKEVLIRNDERINNIQEIKYKTSQDTEVRTASIQNISEFGIGTSQKYIRATVAMDRSSNETKSLSTTRNAVLKEETQFLRVLVEGHASLYSYKEGTLERFFLQVDNEEIEQLIYKRFTSPDSKIRENNRYKQQILNKLSCGESPQFKIERLHYRIGPLMELVQDFNQCTNEEYTIFLRKDKSIWNYRAKLGINLTNFSTHQDNFKIIPDFNYKIDPRLGVEVEYIFPFSNNKFGIFVEPGFTMHKAQHDILVPYGVTGPFQTGPATLYIDYKALLIPIGARYYFFLDDNLSSRIFINGGVSLNVLFNSTHTIHPETLERRNIEFNNSYAPTAFAGFGFSYNEKLSFETRYYPIKTIHNERAFKLHNDHSFAVLLGYKIF